ncbi:hypothetical protein [Halalkalicoccus jeotgali]|uniref:Uncharacterized protein n=1 Tax=Halalkalicoccus jeotgali (strain DSM 18796 / CECT 7217 / JCM 14584 / KCTC 4019 / B3) TaxID=795797 RepID=D8J9W8_HALJB|nr:hypothetical protein [Halalkalicoccus jeotgali]ADJ14490.1 hypothetical protein HacjB3_05495 [Halalkalicoccus jeotgali B3]ELY40204.1 hypothetical protein C497_03870 [Halalkalicoccus jeotgali B3]
MEDNRNYADECGDHGGTNSRGDPCGRAAGWGTDFDSGKCRKHRGTSPDGSSHEGNQNAVGNRGGDGAPEGNDRAVTHGAYREGFLENYLTDEEASRVEIVEEILSTPKGSQKHARMMAGVALEQFRRSGDERFLREYRQLCDKAQIFPGEEMEHNHRHAHQHQHDHDYELGEREHSALDSITGGPDEIAVEAVEDTSRSGEDGSDSEDQDSPEIGW